MLERKATSMSTLFRLIILIYEPQIGQNNLHSCNFMTILWNRNNGTVEPRSNGPAFNGIPPITDTHP